MLGTFLVYLWLLFEISATNAWKRPTCFDKLLDAGGEPLAENTAPSYTSSRTLIHIRMLVQKAPCTQNRTVGLLGRQTGRRRWYPYDEFRTYIPPPPFLRYPPVLHHPLPMNPPYVPPPPPYIPRNSVLHPQYYTNPSYGIAPRFSHANIMGAASQSNYGQSGNAQAIYFQTNDPNQNSIVAVAVNADGTVGPRTTVTPSGGKGRAGITAVTNSTNLGPDQLFSQDSVRVGDQFVFVVNAGDNTLSMLAISPTDPLSLSVIGSPASTYGDFPMSVAYSSAIKQACVLNGGAKDGVTCFSVDATNGLSPLDTSPRALNIGQSTPPAGPPGTASDIFFSPDSSALFVTVKGNAATNLKSFVAGYPVTNGVVSQMASITFPTGTAVLFGSVMPRSGWIVASDASFGAVLLAVTAGSQMSLQAQVTTKITIKNQTASCWAALSNTTSSVFVVEVNFCGAIVRTYNLMNGGTTGNFDSAVGGNYLYSLSPRQGLVVIRTLDLTGGQGNGKELPSYTVNQAGRTSIGTGGLPRHGTVIIA